MSEKVVLKRQVYLSVEQYNTLKSTGRVTVDGKTIEFSENDEYITPDTTGADITAVRQELLKEVQKKADTSYVDEKVENVGGKLYHHSILLFWDNENISQDYLRVSFPSKHSTEFTKDEFEIEFKTLQRVEPCIRYYDLGSVIKQGTMWFEPQLSHSLVIMMNGAEGLFTLPSDYEIVDLLIEI